MTSKTIYDYPLYYDILFSWDRSQEADFYEAAFLRYGVSKHEPVLEVACGPGRIARCLARRGWSLTGIDHRPEMVAFLLEQAGSGMSIDAECADMTSFTCTKSFGAVYNPLSSFRLLHDSSDVDAHLTVVSRLLRPGGIYVLDMEFLGDGNTETNTTGEGWAMRRGNITVQATDAAVLVNDDGTRLTLDWGQEVHLVDYSANAFIDRVAANGFWSIEAWHAESGQSSEGVSQFSVDEHAPLPAVGRTMVVLRDRGLQGT